MDPWPPTLTERQSAQQRVVEGTKADAPQAVIAHLTPTTLRAALRSQSLRVFPQCLSFVHAETHHFQSDRSLQNVTAVASWFDKDGNFIKSADALIDFNPILPGQTSPYKTITSSNFAMARFTIEFKTLMGGSLSVDDQRKKDQRKEAGLYRNSECCADPITVRGTGGVRQRARGVDACAVRVIRGPSSQWTTTTTNCGGR